MLLQNFHKFETLPEVISRNQLEVAIVRYWRLAILVIILLAVIFVGFYNW